MGKVDKKNIKKLNEFLKKTNKISVYLKQHNTVSAGLCDKPQANK